MSITDDLAAYSSALAYDDLPDETVTRAKQVLLDTLGVAVGSVRAESTDTILEAVDALDDDAGPSTVLVTGVGRAPATAALANGAAAHSLDFDETHRPGSVHAAAPVLGGALAAGEAAEASGADLLAALVGGYEVTARLGMALNSEAHYAKGFHATSTCGVFGATAASCRLRGFDAATTATAFGINGSQASGSLQFLESGAWNKRLHPGLAAHAGHLATAFADAGFVAATEPIEGPRGFLQAYSDDPLPERALDGLGDGHEIDRTGLKPYPLCRFVHPAIDGLVDLVTANDIAPEAVTNVDVELSTAGYNIVGDPANPYPESVVDAQFSMPFGAMLAVTRREAGVDALFDAVTGEFSSLERRLMDATTASPAEWADERYPEKWAAAVRVETDRDAFERRVTDARGDPQTPLTWAEIRAKYDELVPPVVGEGVAETLRSRVESVEDQSVRSLLEPLRNAEF